MHRAKGIALPIYLIVYRFIPSMVDALHYLDELIQEVLLLRQGGFLPAAPAIWPLRTATPRVSKVGQIMWIVTGTSVRLREARP